MAVAIAMQAAELPIAPNVVDYVSIANTVADSSRVLPIASFQRSQRRHSPKKNLLNVSRKKLHCRRGVSRGGGGGLEAYPESLIPHGNLVDKNFIDTVQDAIKQYESDSDRSSPNTAQFLDNSNNNWPVHLTGGNTTDRSSSYSTATYDEDFDREASLNVQRLFDDIDSVLFETEGIGVASKLGSTVHYECKDWSDSFPHLRVLGHQMLNSTEQGYGLFESPSSSAVASADPHGRGVNSSNYTDSVGHGDTSSLSIEGSHMRVQSYTPTSTSDSYDYMNHLNEEVFEVDGYYEDIIAIDSDPHEDAVDSVVLASHRQRRSRYPPVTPNACAKDDVTNSVFDVVWNIVTGAVRVLLQRYSEHFVITHPMPIAGTDEVDQEDEHLKLPQILHSGSRLDGNLPMLHGSQRQHIGSMFSRSIVGPIHSGDQLEKILHISKMGMNTREKTFSEDGTDTPMSPMLINNMKVKGNGARNTSARGRGHLRVKALQPIDRVKTPNVDDEVHGIRGRGMGLPVGKRNGSPPLPLGSRMLPPINQSDIQIPPLAQAEAAPRMVNKKGNRASSAIPAEKESRPNIKDKAAFIAETRPSTTHTIYPTDPSGIMDRLNMRPRNGDAQLGITGSSLIGPTLDEEVEGRYAHVSQHNHWGARSTRLPFRQSLAVNGMEDGRMVLLVRSALGQRSELTRSRETASASHCNGRASS